MPFLLGFFAIRRLLGVQKVTSSNLVRPTTFPSQTSFLSDHFSGCRKRDATHTFFSRGQLIMRASFGIIVFQ